MTKLTNSQIQHITANKPNVDFAGLLNDKTHLTDAQLQYIKDNSEYTYTEEKRRSTDPFFFVVILPPTLLATLLFSLMLLEHYGKI